MLLSNTDEMGEGAMTYYSNEGILIRNLEPGDVEVIVREELEQGWQASADKYETRLA